MSLSAELQSIDFRSIDREIYQSISDGREAEEKRDRTRSAKKYRFWEAKMHEAQDRYTAAWSARAEMCQRWDDYYKKAYPNQPA